jgi:hypothetical protein
MGGLAGGLFGVFELFGFLLFTVLIGPSRAERRKLRSSRVIVGGILFSAAVGGILAWIFKLHISDDALSPWAGASLVGGLTGFILALILLAYVSNVERDDRRERRQKQ